MENNIFEINNLQCSYNQTDVVLEIEKLSIPRSSFIFILGVSGGGKSTLLETLGLMNNTIHSGSVVLTPADNKSYELNSLWMNGNQSDIPYIRNHYYSFIFQSTNLMPNFNVFENICLTQMLDGKSYAESKKYATEIMIEVGLPVVNEHQKVTSFSIGQRQRIAFVRAITSEFDVIFGDEPTGNLDTFYAEELLSLLRKIVKEKNRTAIIVSHDIEKALQFADQIILLTKGNKEKAGKIYDKNIFRCFRKDHYTTWINYKGKTVHNPKKRISDILNADRNHKSNQVENDK